MNQEELAMTLLSIGKSVIEFDKHIDESHKRKRSSRSNENEDASHKRGRSNQSNEHIDEGSIITKSSEKPDNPISKEDMIRYYAMEVDGLIQEAQKQNLHQIASWFIENKEDLCVLYDPQYTYIAPSHTPPGPSRYYELLHTAAMHDRKDVIKFLCHLGYDINLYNKDLETPLGICIAQCKTELVKYFLGQGADVNKGSHYNFESLNKGTLGLLLSPLNIAMVENNFQIALLLRSRGGYIQRHPSEISWLSNLSPGLAEDKYKFKDDTFHRLILMNGCLEAECKDLRLLQLKPKIFKKVISFGSNLEKVLCGLYFLNKSLEEYYEYKSENFKNIITILMEELAAPMLNLAHLGDQRETFLTKLETKKVLYERISNECSKIISLNKPPLNSAAKWVTVISEPKDQEFLEICSSLKEKVQTHSQAPVNEVNLATEETLDQTAVMGDYSGGVEETKGNG
ncbi:hypothetical protein phytr_410 [Candidatus Phycorickettsia trachydisci]|uniref:Uncharacterized protein n=1 Tax=Candidatus Phycorickettsia trachydisci TaxID=2115978 RepID=A0A2P1P6V4_9RICK|nr:ankyrin repeat domain-containing protein [Candidatus Phycorickettsia trachydisci]AVP87004.1 hypothetical protein phytr_410 [Candidatus Phycorickettsia trachydisci]